MKSPFKITVVYDNHPPAATGLQSSWGFSCAIEGFDRTVLFDTGTSGPILMDNLAALSFDPAQFDAIVVSHGDWDHLGGLWNMLAATRNLEVYLPTSLSRHLKDEVRDRGARPVSVGPDPVRVCPGLLLGGEMEGPRREQALLLEVDRANIALTGCAHPGIVDIVRHLRELASKPLPMLAMGGFHLKDRSADEIAGIIQQLETLGVRWAAPTHCSGNLAETLFSERYGSRRIALRPGSVLTAEDLAED